jgi:proline dehydrogenase
LYGVEDPKVSFDNTEIAFSSRTDGELKNARRLFKAFNYRWLVVYGPKLVEWSLKLGLPVKGLIRKTVFNHFCGGESIDDCEPTVDHLKASGIGTILDYSVEGENTDKNFDNTLSEILKTVEASSKYKSIPFCVFKTTGIARFELLEKVQSGERLTSDEEDEWNRVRSRFDSICKAAHDAETKVFVDAEESWIQEPIDSLTMEMMAKYNGKRAIVFNTIQLYRHDRLDFLMSCINNNEFFQGYKLVRGAYMEQERKRAKQMNYPSPIQPDKESSDRDYNAALKLCIENLGKVEVCAGTHNEESSTYLCELMKENNILFSDSRVYFAQLLGMSDHISFNLSHSGYRVAKYVPYGPVKSVMPYLGRRAAENSSIGGQIGRELHLLQNELERRKN